MALKPVALLEINADRPGQRLECAAAIPWSERHDVIAAAEPVNRLIEGVGLARLNEIFVWEQPVGVFCRLPHLDEKVQVEIRQRNDVRLRRIMPVLPPFRRDRPQAFGQIKFAPIGLKNFLNPLTGGDQ